MVEEIKMIKLINDIVFRPDSRLALLGKSGTGKSTFAKNKILPKYNKFIFHDSKIENSDVEHDILVTNPKDLKKSIDTGKYNRILYQPKNIGVEDFNAVSKVVFENWHDCFYIDEVMEVSSVNKIEYYHKLLITQGRSKGIGVINVSQRPSDIHNSILSETTDFFVFRLSLDPDIVKMQKIIGSAADEIGYLPYYHFLYANEMEVRLLYDTNLNPYKPRLEDYIAKIRV